MVIIPGIEVDEARLAAICDRYEIAELKVFGSRDRGQTVPDSDIDVLYTLPARAAAAVGDRAAEPRPDLARRAFVWSRSSWSL